MANISQVVEVQKLTSPVNSTATVTSGSVDVSGYTGSNFYVSYGDSADTLSGSIYWAAKLKECATENGTYTDVSTDDILGPTTNEFGLVDAPTEDQKIYHIGYNGSLSWVKVEVTATGSHASGTPIGVFYALGLPRSQTADTDYNP